MTIFEIVFLVLGTYLILDFLFSPLYLAFGLNRWFYHDILKWHQPSEKETFNGCSFCSTCKYCGKEIMQDSQGNWF